MVTVKYYDSPLGLIFLAADDTGLIGLWFEGQKYFAQTLTRNYQTGSTPILESAVRWLRGVFFRRKTLFHAASPSDWNRLPDRGLEAPSHRSLWNHRDVRRYRKTGGRAADRLPPFSAGGGRHDEPKPDFNHYSEPSGGAGEREPHGLRGRRHPPGETSDA